MDTSLVIDLAMLSAIVAGLIQGFKAAIGDKFTRFMPLAADLLGALGGYLFLGGSKEAVALGIIAGLSASGLYSQTKTVAGR